MVRLLFIFFFYLFILSPAWAIQADFDVVHYDIQLDISNLNSKTISGHCEVSLTAKINSLSEIALDLLGLSVDSVTINNAAVTYTYNDTLLAIQLPFPLNIYDSIAVKVFYHGQPVTDASGWGGFYFQSGYAFNLGVGFAADPHTYGRVWFPCVDNFIDRATYDFYITTNTGNKAFCNGVLENSIDNGNGTTMWHWSMQQNIPTYLASVAVSSYTAVEYDHVSITGDTIPVVLAARANDTANFKNSFINLPGSIEAFETGYGPYQFDRVGFVLVPFSSGAMEHATNVAFPRFGINGTLQYESLMAHEFSHHWWGDLVTCSTAEDMWLNEGWASYSEAIFFEHVYGKERYAEEVGKNHKNVLQYTHVRDNGYRAVSGIPHQYTYGSTVYDKGADVAHTLRGYLGDPLFFQCISSYLTAFSFNDAGSEDFRDHLSQCSGIDLTDFFDNWVFNPGFPHFSIDSFFSNPASGEYEVVVYLRQKLKAAPEYYSNVPLELTFFSENWDTATRTVSMDEGCAIYFTELSFDPVYVAVDIHEKISDAITDHYLIIDTVGNYDFEEALMTLNVTRISDSAFVRVEHNWVAPDPIKMAIPGLHISTERYWKVDGLFPPGFSANAVVDYNGTTSLSGGYLDNELMTNSEDSLRLLYRKDAGEDWMIADSFEVEPQLNLNNKRGQITIYAIQKGEYALAIFDHNIPDSNIVLPVPSCIVLGNDASEEQAVNGFYVFPNPADDSFRVEFEKPVSDELLLSIFDITGRKIQNRKIAKGEQSILIDANGWPKMLYLVKVFDKEKSLSKKLMIIK